jgi:cytochrome c553
MKRSVLLLLTVVAGVVFFAAGLNAGTAVQDIIKMENKAYESHKKGIVTFSHKKHMEVYATQNPELYKKGCGECHHDKENKPLTLKAGDAVQNCIECHNKPGESPKGKDAPQLSKKEQMTYHAEAMHENCKGCHKAFNQAKNSKAAPVTCVKCHPKKDKEDKEE